MTVNDSARCSPSKGGDEEPCEPARSQRPQHSACRTVCTVILCHTLGLLRRIANASLKLQQSKRPVELCLYLLIQNKLMLVNADRVVQTP